MSRPVWTFTPPLILGYLAILVLVAGFALWGSFSQLAGAIVAQGRIEVEQSRQIVQHPDGGVVAEILTREGGTVTAGDILIRLDGTLIASELAIVEGQLSETRARRARLEAERDGLSRPLWPEVMHAEAGADSSQRLAEQIEGQQRLFDTRRTAEAQEAEQMARQIGQIRQRILGIDAQERALDLQLTLIGTELSNQRGLLEKGLTQASSVLALQREEARLMGQIGELQASRASSLERITELEVQSGRLGLQRREEATRELRDTGPAELELAERRRALRERIARLDIRAPVPGRVMGLQTTSPRGVLRAADPVLHIVPQDRPLVIAAQIPTIHIDQVYQGQPSELVFSAFAARSTPHLKGVVTRVSADAFTDQTTAQSFYRVEISLDEGEVERLSGLTLLPGMPVEAFLMTESRSPLAYLIQPFTDYFSHAFRES